MSLLVVQAWIREAQRIVVLTGAGMSAELACRRFAHALTGLWANFNPQDLATEAAFRARPTASGARTRTVAPSWIRSSPMQARPSAGGISAAPSWSDDLDHTERGWLAPACRQPRSHRFARQPAGRQLAGHGAPLLRGAPECPRRRPPAPNAAICVALRWSGLARVCPHKRWSGPNRRRRPAI